VTKIHPDHLMLQRVILSRFRVPTAGADDPRMTGMTVNSGFFLYPSFKTPSFFSCSSTSLTFCNTESYGNESEKTVMLVILFN
jgi:hypothetical protein